MRNTLSFVNNEKGAVLLISMIVLTAVVMLGMGMLVNNQMNSAVAANYKKRIQSFYAADGLITKVAQEIVDTNQYKYLKFVGTDIGSPALTGSDSTLKNKVTINAGGSDIWNASDQFHFAYIKMSGDMDISVRVDSITFTDSLAKAGLMIRETTAPGSKHTFMAMTWGKGAALQSRIATDGSTIQQTSSGRYCPYWVRLKRSGDTLTGFAGLVNGGWDTIGTIVNSMVDPVCVGIAVTSHNASVLTTSTVSGLSGVTLADTAVDSTFGIFPVRFFLNVQTNNDLKLSCKSFRLAGADSTFQTTLRQVFIASTGYFLSTAPDTVTLPVVLYDYRADGSNPDFQQQNGWGSPSGAPQPYRDMIQRKIGPNRKPLLNTSCDPTWRNQVYAFYASHPNEEAQWGIKRSGVVPRQVCWNCPWVMEWGCIHPYRCWGSMLDSLYKISSPTVSWWWNDHINQWFWPNRGAGATFNPVTNRYTAGLVPNVIDASGLATVAGNANMNDSMANIVFYDSLKFIQQPANSGAYVFPADGFADPQHFLACTTAAPNLEWNDFRPDTSIHDTSISLTYAHCLPGKNDSTDGFGRHVPFFNPPSGSRGNFFPLKDRGFKGDCPEVDTSDPCWRHTNFSYAIEFHKQFVYKPGQVFTFEGDDDTWIFINDSLVVDIGGVHSAIAGTANLDLLNLVVGNTYWLDFFSCDRMSPGCDIRITTNMFYYATLPTRRYWKRDYGNLN